MLLLSWGIAESFRAGLNRADFKAFFFSPVFVFMHGRFVFRGKDAHVFGANLQ